jgi:hypothetical protein
VECETTIAYLAGIVDGEAYVGIKRARRKDSVSPIYHERIQVRMLDGEAIQLLAATFGGSLYREKPHANNGRPLVCWQASDALAARILTELLPYLRVKRSQAENALALRVSKNDPRARLRGGPTGRAMPAEVLAVRQELYEQGKRLNAKGGDALYGAVSE